MGQTIKVGVLIPDGTYNHAFTEIRSFDFQQAIFTVEKS